METLLVRAVYIRPNSSSTSSLFCGLCDSMYVIAAIYHILIMQSEQLSDVHGKTGEPIYTGDR